MSSGTNRIARVIAEAGYSVYRPFGNLEGDVWLLSRPSARRRWTRAARVLAQWAERVPAMRITVPRVAHALHAAWTVTCIRHEGLQRHECRAWAAESVRQRQAYCEAAERLAPLLRGRHAHSELTKG